MDKGVMRYDLINHLISRFGYKSYLEIGCKDNECFNAVVCEDKVGVDPVSGGNVRATSDEFFAKCGAMKWDCVFVDGLHECQQVNRDITNALKHLNPGGSIVLHDCSPRQELDQLYPFPGLLNEWNGDVWRCTALWRTYGHVDIATGDFDQGCGVIRVRPNTQRWQLDESYLALPWKYLEDNRCSLLRLKTLAELKEWL